MVKIPSIKVLVLGIIIFICVILIGLNINFFVVETKSAIHKNQQYLAAKNWYIDRGINIEKLKEMSGIEVSKKLAAAVFNFCRSPTDGLPQTNTKNMHNLYKTCVARCGGYSYVLRGLLEYIGYETRYANLHNIPEQGNHTGVEVKFDYGWGFVDPTFGLFFSDNKKYDGNLLSLRKIVSSRLSHQNVFRVKNKESFKISNSLEQIFTNRYKINEPVFNEGSQISISSYQNFEQLEYREKDFMMPLIISLDVKNLKSISFGSDKIKSFDEMEKKWLDSTNILLADSIPENDISFNTSILSNNLPNDRLTILSLTGLQPKKKYKLETLIYNKYNNAKIQISNLGKNLKHNFKNIIDLKKGSSIISGQFFSHSESAQFLIRNAKQNSTIRLFGLKIYYKDEN